MISVAERVVVAFSGAGSGTGPLSWGQQDIWQAMVRQRSWLPNGAWGPLPAGTTVDDVADRLRYLMSRFPTARTRLRFDAAGRPEQVVHDTGETTLEIVDAGAADPAEVAEALRLQYQDADYDFVTEWPVRMAAVRHGGALTHLVVVMCHLITDGFGSQVLLDELDTRPDTPIPDLQPLEQARWQASPAGQRQNSLALRHWDGILRAMPPRRFPESADKRQPRHWRGEFTSYALAPALRTVTERTGVGSAPALLAVFAIALARVTGVNPVVVRPMVNNRFRPGLDRVVCMLAQYGLCMLDVAGASFAEALDRARRSALTTYKHAYYDPARLDELIARVVAERGDDLELPCYFNDRRGEPTGAVPEPARLRAALSRGEFRWTTQQDVPFEPLIVHVDDVPGDAVRAILFMDTHVVSPGDGEALLRGLEAVAVEAALDPSAPTGV
ncbi:condensation domain-containing protein [Dactylosporangium fulvum]|uniref:Condensation domain-containing protein n=1 Tax=Dactylosporangium fulvum TaxID=53359 RepID=A0ABY5WAM1_9ACTN|nr:condensation domain-containing protein [Dactylosporangium fulvum]UWP87113.1 condensation domain-containing protein [Dactylosporangium fulvum]